MSRTKIVPVKWGVYEARLKVGKHPVIVFSGPDSRGLYKVVHGRTRSQASGGTDVPVLGGFLGDRMGLFGPTHFWEQDSSIHEIPAADFLGRRGSVPLNARIDFEELVMRIEVTCKICGQDKTNGSHRNHVLSQQQSCSEPGCTSMVKWACQGTVAFTCCEKDHLVALSAP